MRGEKSHFESKTTCFPTHGESPASWGGWAAALQWTSLSSRVVTNETRLTISSLYAVVPVLRRNYTLTLATDI
jgi:hypothetical protein